MGSFDEAQKEYKAVRGRVETLCYTGNVRQRSQNVLHALKAFAQNYDNEEVSLKIRQDALCFMANTYCQHLTKIEGYMDTALEYATRSLELLESFEVKEGADFELRKISVTHVLANICLDKDELKRAGEMCDEGLACQSIINDPALHMVLLDIKRKSLSRENRLECSLKMLKVYQAGLRSNKKEKFDVHIFLGKDYITNKCFADAEKCYCEIYFDPACRNFDKDSFAKAHLIGLYKLNRCLEKCHEMEGDESIDPILMARMYEKVADFAVEKLCAYEFAIEYYAKMLQSAKNLDESFQPEKFNLIHDSLASLAETFSDIHNFQQSVKYYDELYQISNVAKELLADIKLNSAIKMINCVDVSFDEKEQALCDAYHLLRTSIHHKHFFGSYMKLLDIYEKQTTSTNTPYEYLARRYDDYKEDVAENDYASGQISAPSFAVFDEIDAMPDKDIMKIVKQKRKNQVELEGLKKNISHRNLAGESELHRAVKKRENGLEFTKLLIESCGYCEIIDQQDYLGMTPLFYSLMYEKYDIAKYYIRNGGNVNISTTKTFSREDGSIIPSGQTPLMIASAYGNVEMTQMLIDNGADPLMKDETGTTAEEYMTKYHRRISDVSMNESNGEIRKIRSYTYRQVEYEMGVSEGAEFLRVITFEWNDGRRVREYSERKGRTNLRCLDCNGHSAQFIDGKFFVRVDHDCHPRDYFKVKEIQILLANNELKKVHQLNKFKNFTTYVEEEEVPSVQALLLQHQHTVIPLSSSPTSSTSSSQPNLLNMIPGAISSVPSTMPHVPSNFPSLDMENAFRSHPTLAQSLSSKPAPPRRQYSSTSTKGYCHLCNKELCRKSYLRTHMLKVHNIVMDENKTVIANIDTQENEKDSASSSKPPSAVGLGASQNGETAALPPTSQSSDFKCSRCETNFESFQALAGHLHAEHANDISKQEILELLTKFPSSVVL